MLTIWVNLVSYLLSYAYCVCICVSCVCTCVCIYLSEYVCVHVWASVYASVYMCVVFVNTIVFFFVPASHGRSKVCISGNKQKTTPTKEALPKRNLVMQFYGPVL